MLGHDSKLDLAFLNVKHRVGDIALLEHVLILVKFQYRFPRSHFGKKVWGQTCPSLAFPREPPLARPIYLILARPAPKAQSLLRYFRTNNRRDRRSNQAVSHSGIP